MSESTAPPAEEPGSASVQKIRTLLGAKDDTSRFVGLALLKSVLDNTPELRSNEETVTELWEAIPAKFLDRLIRTGCKHKSPDSSASASRKGSNDMLDLAVSVLHTFSVLLPEDARRNPKLLDRVPQLVACLLYSSDDTTRLVLETLVGLVSQPDGAQVFTSVQDLSPLTEIASSQPLALDTLLYAWLNAMTATTDKEQLRSRIDSTVGSLVTSFKGTDAVTLLSFLSNLLPRLEPQVLPFNPRWLPSLAKYIRDLVASRPTSAGRTAFTNLSAALLEVYPLQAPQLLFAEQGPSSENPFSYLLINLLLVDLRATLPTLLAQLNSAAYIDTARRLTSAFNILSHFIGYLLRSIDSPPSPQPQPSSSSTKHTDDSTPWTISPDLLLKLRKSISETLSLTTEYLRDRWDASVAGALGLHPDARTGVARTAGGAEHLTLAWDAASEDMSAAAGKDPLILAAVRALAIWLREDENEMLRGEAAGLGDVFVDLYRGSGGTSGDGGGGEGRLDFRRPVLVAFEGLVVERKGREAVLENGGWKVLVDDLLSILERTTSSSTGGDDIEAAAARGVEIVRVLLQVAESERPGPQEAWLDLVTRVAAWDVPSDAKKQPPVVVECQVAALQLVTTLLANSPPGVQRRYVHSTSAVLGIARRLREQVAGDGEMVEALEDVLGTLGALR